MPTPPNFANRTVWTGDNLDILRGMNSATVDLIYLDPPFNSNRTYEAPVGSVAAGAAFKDSWSLSDLDVAWMGLIADEHPAIAYALDTAGRTHGKGMQSYLTMMAVRLLELRRVLKPLGSIYLHCDPFASHYLKLLMDAVFGRAQYRNQVSWQRNDGRGKGSQFAAKAWGRNTDVLLYYAKSPQTEIRPYRTLTDAEIAAKFPKVDADGRRYYTGIPVFCSRSMGDRPNLCFEWRGFENPHPSGWRLSRERLEQEYAKGNIVIRDDGRLERRKYFADYPGEPMDDFWDDIPRLTDNAERTGYPTQKPRALLERIIAASSNPGDVVLDPFCGCATACVAAERLDRQWVGIDLSPKAAELVLYRLDGPEYGAMFRRAWVTHRTDIPQRTDIAAPKNYRQHKHVLYGQQEGCCAGCAMHFPFKVFEVDHIVPKSRGGANHLDNLQLLCGHCNRVKGDRDQAYLRAHLEAVAT